MWAAAWAGVAVWVSLSFLQPGGGIKTTAWQRVLVDPSVFMWRVTYHTKTLPLIFCGAECTEESWCSAWCFVQLDQCRLTDLTVSPSYIPTQPTDALQCYTKSRKDIVFGASVVSSPVHPNRTARVAENLVDGYYPNYLEDCAYIYDRPGGAWIQFDLLSVFSITEVLLKAETNEGASKYFQDIEVRVGMSSMASLQEFSSFTLLGFFAGPGVQNQTVVLRPAAPLTGRYVSVQRMSKGNLQVCHVEVR